ncbi:response regulator transcription factor [Micromonospora fulviviridis]|uniref:Response regulator transcription factor n=1 Tax=Micromonospora fulviviridis TaxID=47860 RepID=A0ABV2VUT2_9ACTN
MIDVMVVDDNPIVRAALVGVLAAARDIHVVAQAGNGQEALALARKLRPAVTLLDYRMPIADGLSVVTALAEHTCVLALTSDSSDDIIRGMLLGGARGYLVHGQFEPPDLERAVRAVAAGQGWLSPTAASVATSVLRSHAERDRERRLRAERIRAMQARFGLTARERDVLNLVSLGLSNAAIANRLDLTEKTVKNHLNHAFAKLQVTNRTEAMIVWSGRTLETEATGPAGR